MRNIPSHFRNQQAHSAFIRYGIPIVILITLGLILASHIGSGASAELVFTENGTLIDEAVLLTVSIFTSVSALWGANSIALAMLVVLTSVCWPYLKLILALFAWMAPIWNAQRRERLLHSLDVLGKWSFVDIFILLIISVAFRSTTSPGPGLFIDVYVVPKWGFYGFVFACIMSLLVTHFILYRHRLVLYDKAYLTCEYTEQAGIQSSMENGTPTTPNAVHIENTYQKLFPGREHRIWNIFAVASLISSFALLLSGACVLMFMFNYTTGSSQSSLTFALGSIGVQVPQVSRYSAARFGVRWIQIMYFILSIAAPLWNIILMFILYFRPLRKSVQRRLLFLCEVTFAWGAAEVFIISAIFSVFQIPKFGTGIVKSGCTGCYTVTSVWMPTIAVYAVGAFINLITNLVLIHRAQRVLNQIDC